MTLSLEELRQISQSRTDTVLQSQYTSQTINPPTWSALTQTSDGVNVRLNEPMQDNGQPYLAQSAGLIYPATSDQGGIFFYQVQLDDDGAFGSPVTYDLATSTTKSISGIYGTFYARARARLTNGTWSDWRPYSTSITSNQFILPIDFTTAVTAGGTVAGMWRAMDGVSTDTGSYCEVFTTTAATDTASFFVGPFAGTTRSLPNVGVTLNIRSGVPTNSLGATVTCYQSWDGNETLGTVYNISGTRAITTDSFVKSDVNYGLTRVQFNISGGVGVGSCNIRIYDVWLSVTA